MASSLVRLCAFLVHFVVVNEYETTINGNFFNRHKIPRYIIAKYLSFKSNYLRLFEYHIRLADKCFKTQKWGKLMAIAH